MVATAQCAVGEKSCCDTVKSDGSEMPASDASNIAASSASNAHLCQQYGAHQVPAIAISSWNG